MIGTWLCRYLITEYWECDLLNEDTVSVRDDGLLIVECRIGQLSRVVKLKLKVKITCDDSTLFESTLDPCPCLELGHVKGPNLHAFSNNKKNLQDFRPLDMDLGRRRKLEVSRKSRS